MNGFMKCGMVLLFLLMALSFGVALGEKAATNATPVKEIKVVKGPVTISKVNFGKIAQWIEIKNNGTSSQNLTGWKLQVSSTPVYTFPKFVLDANAKVSVHSGTGKDSKANLYAKKALLTKATDKVSLLDEKGTVVSTS